MIAMTMMVRDEADIVGAMIRYHLDQGVGLFLVTDNGSVDGTREILEDFAARGEIELSHDPRHLKQQHEVVTRMSREAARRGATWVLNADADEFWAAATPGVTVAEELAGIDPAIGAFPVPVTDMTGAPARSGTGLQRLLYRDERPDDVMRALGIHAHATDDVAFAAREDVEVAQGNHFVDVEPAHELPAGRGLRVYHFPWRSWEQFHRKVENAGRAYEASPHLRPSANHHGMRDYRRLKDGLLSSSYVARHPSDDEIQEGLRRGWFVRDTTIADLVPSPVPDVAIPEAEAQADRALMRGLRPLEERLRDLEVTARETSDRLEFELRHVQELDDLVARLRAESEANARRREEAERELDQLRRSRLVRTAEGVSRLRWRKRG
jgi:hypothetical protein